MSFTPSFGGIASNGATPVTVVAAPALRTQRLIRRIILHNADTVTGTVTVKHVTSGGSSFILLKQAVTAGQEIVVEHVILDATTQTITAELGGAVTTTEWDFTASFADLAP